MSKIDVIENAREIEKSITVTDKKDAQSVLDRIKNGEIIVAGYSNSTNAGFDNKGNYDAIIVSYDSRGNQEQIDSIKIKNQNNSAQLEIVRGQLNRLP